MNRGNQQRLPMLSIHNKNENSAIARSKNKLIDQNGMIILFMTLAMSIDDFKNNNGLSNTKNLNNSSSNIKSYSIKDEKNAFMGGLSGMSEKQMADGEFLKNVQKALQNAINENEEVIFTILIIIINFT